MDRLPVPEEVPCVCRVVHVSGTIRKVEEEAIRRARLLILQAQEGKSAAQSSDVLKSLFASDAIDDNGSSVEGDHSQEHSGDEDAAMTDTNG
jgi:ribonuclease P/MRP protein subunit POP5